MNKQVAIKTVYSIKKASNPQNICEGCALRVGVEYCLLRKACPDDGTGLNLQIDFTKTELLTVQPSGVSERAGLDVFSSIINSLI